MIYFIFLLYLFLSVVYERRINSLIYHYVPIKRMPEFDAQLSAYAASHGALGGITTGIILAILGLFSLTHVFFFGFGIFLVRYFGMLFLASYFDKKDNPRPQGSDQPADQKPKRKGSHPWDV